MMKNVQRMIKWKCVEYFICYLLKEANQGQQNKIEIKMKIKKEGGTTSCIKWYKVQSDDG